MLVLRKLDMDTLRSARVLRHIAPEDLRAFGGGMRLHRLLRGQVLLEQGRRNDAMALVAEGRLVVDSRAPGGAEVALGSYYPGDTVGVLDCLVPDSALANVRAAETSTVFLLDHDGLEGIQRRFPGIAADLRTGALGELVALLRETNSRIEDVLQAGGEPASAPDTVEPGNPDEGRRPDERVDLRRVSGLAAFSDEELRVLVDAAPPRCYPSRFVLAAEGAQADSCFIVARGAVRVVRRLRGRRWRLGTMGQGAMVGVLALLDPCCQRSAMYVVDRDDTVVMELQRGAYEALLRGRFSAGHRLQEQIARDGIRQYRVAVQKLVSLLCDDPLWHQIGDPSPEPGGVGRARSRPKPTMAVDASTLNTLMLNYVKTAVNEWGLELDGFDRHARRERTGE